MLLRYNWPGNIRELKNMTERLVVRASETPIRPEDLPRETRGEIETTVTVAVAQPGARRLVARAGRRPPRRARDRKRPSSCGSG